MGGLHGPPIHDRQKQAKTEMRTVAESEWAVDGFGKCDDESVARTIAAIATAAVPDGLELQRAEVSVAKLKRAIAFIALLNCSGSALRVQSEKAEQVMRARADLPAAGVHFRAAIAEGFGVARGDEGRERAPNSGFSEKRTVFEIAGLADAVKDESQFMPLEAPCPKDAPQRLNCVVVKPGRRKDGDVCDVGVPVVGGFGKDMSVLMPLGAGTRENGMAVGFLA